MRLAEVRIGDCVNYKEMNNPVFVHALFKTGSTYLWMKFRERKELCCYYEPFHDFLLEMDDTYESVFQKEDTVIIAGKPITPDPYFREYEALLVPGKKGVPNFQKSFVFDEFCSVRSTELLGRYIDYLIEGAGERRAVLQFNRSALRISWFVKNYSPALNIYLVRNPRDQWASYVRRAEQKSPVFLVMDLMIASLNAKHRLFSPLSEVIPLVEYRAADIQEEKAFYLALLRYYENDERYFVSYYVWLLAFVEAVVWSDLVINMNRLSSDASYRSEVEMQLEGHGVGIDLADARISTYGELAVPEARMVALENLAKQLIFRALPAEVTTQFLDRLPHRESDFFNLSKREVIRLRDNADVGSCFTLEHDKKGQIVRDFYDRNIALTSAYRQLNCEHDSRSYQIGRLVTAPVRHVKRWWLRSTEFWQTDPSGNQARKPVTGKREQAK